MIWPAIFFVSANGKRIVYLAAAISMAIGGITAGALVGHSFFNNPGRKKLAGETLWLVLIPLQPATIGNTAKTDSRSNLQLNLTCRL
jgi:hypothetical protein